MTTLVMLVVIWLLAQPAPSAANAQARAADAHGRALKETVNCVECHAKLVTERYVHGPAGAGGCLDCHEIVAKGQAAPTVALKADGMEGCISCHEEIKTRLAEKHVHAPVASGECTTCHDPHSAPYRYQLKAEGSAACTLCHEDIGEDLKRPVGHEPTANCVTCHDPHGGPFGGQTRRPVNDLCLECHGATAASEDGSPRKPGAPPVNLSADQTQGHPVSRHIVIGPRDPKSPDRPFTCASCHNPHGAKGGKLFRFDAMSLSELCVKCHNM